MAERRTSDARAIFERLFCSVLELIRRGFTIEKIAEVLGRMLHTRFKGGV